MAVMAPSLRLGLAIPQLSKHHHAQSLLGSSFHDPRTPHALESHPDSEENNFSKSLATLVARLREHFRVFLAIFLVAQLPAEVF